MLNFNNPKFILSKKIVLKQYEKVKSISDFVSYSSKTNPLVTPILEKQTGSLFSVHTTNELKHIKDLSRVVFLAQALNQNSIRELISRKVKTFVVDNESDLDEILKFLEGKEGNDVKINLMLRLKLKENTIRTERYFVFGMNSDVVNKRIKEIRANEKLKNKINQLGIHFHRKSQNMAEWNLTYEISNSINEDVMKLIDIMCIGGGLPSDYANTNVNVIDSVFKKIIEFKDWLNKQNVKLMIEPGRFIAAPAVKLETEIIGMHENNIIVNASVYNSDLDALIVPVKLLVEGEVSKEEGSPFVIKGITPCSMDLYRYRVYLKNPKIGDKLVFLNAGAYNFTTDFCDLDMIETEIVDSFN
ncbi:decarboxylase [Candidatus Woesearchaeota archaeon]|nr:decarboxylase [Candidatus Woesearchaeota archaeon]